ncbi:hypothetical protein DQ04_16351010, partial [Trypanosoma grayi]|uniref:hypothetical protein n=1 Tax=Trypanosoma grayi TaxID=71804 RepID=UPI0004F409CA
MLRHVLCVLVLALCCCTSFCVTAEAEASSVPPAVGSGTPAEVSAQEEDVTARTKTLEAANKTEAAAISAKEALESATVAADEVMKAARNVVDECKKGKTDKTVDLVHALHKALRKILLPPKKRVVGKKDPTLADIKNPEIRTQIEGAKKNALPATSLLKDAVGKTAAPVKSADAPVQQARAAVEKASEALKNAAAGATEILDVVRNVNGIALKGSTAAVQLHTALTKVADVMKRISESLGTVLNLADDTLVLANSESASAGTQTEDEKFANLTKTAKNILDDFDALMSEAENVTDAADAALTAADAVVTEVTAAEPEAAAAVKAATTAKAAARDALTQAEGA